MRRDAWWWSILSFTGIAIISRSVAGTDWVSILILCVPLCCLFVRQRELFALGCFASTLVNSVVISTSTLRILGVSMDGHDTSNLIVACMILGALSAWWSMRSERRTSWQEVKTDSE